MSTQLVTHVWCDFHEQTEGVQVPGEAHALVVDGVSTEIDLCSDCARPLAELTAFLALYGRTAKRVGRPRAAEATEECPACGQHYKHVKNVRQHMLKAHGVSLKGWLAGERPEDPAKLPTEVNGEAGYQCPECERVFAKPQGLARHRSAAHVAA